MHGDMGGYLALITHAHDHTLAAPFGGAPARGFDASPERSAELARCFQAGTSRLEPVQTDASGDMVVLVTIERQQGEIGGLPEQHWSPRVTLVFRREGSEWLLARRHADPLVNNIGLERAAAIARSD